MFVENISFPCVFSWHFHLLLEKKIIQVNAWTFLDVAILDTIILVLDIPTTLNCQYQKIEPMSCFIF